MAAITPQAPGLNGVGLTYGNADVSNDLVPNPKGNVLINIRNTGGNGITVTIPGRSLIRPADGAFPAMTLPDLTCSVAQSVGDKWIGSIPAGYNDSNGNVVVQYSAVTGVKIAAMQIPS